MAVPASLAEVWKRATLVAIVRIDTDTPTSTPVPGTDPLVRLEHTLYRATVLDLIKSPDSGIVTGGSVEIQRTGARHGVPDEDYELDDGYAPFEVGGQYLLLMGNDYRDGRLDHSYSPNFGGASAYRIAGGRISRMSDDPVAIRQQDRKADDMVKELRQLARGSKK